ncbi:MAG TPA: PHP domain-containing protein [Myxococcaceae bacterium]|nr:PHP domain-containing protein [Myxococcaceae bacterium]
MSDAPAQGGGAKPPEKIDAAKPVVKVAAAKPAPAAKAPPPRQGKGLISRAITGLVRRVRALVRFVRRLVVVTVLVLVVYLGICAFLAMQAPYPNEASGLFVPKGYVAGAYHVHTTASDGRGTPWEIAQAAKRAGLSFVILTDHNVTPLPPHWEEGVLIIHGIEHSTASGHLIQLGGERALLPAELHDKPVQHVVRLGGTAFLAHPVQSKSPWRDWNGAAGAAGLELYSADTMLRDAQRQPFARLLPAIGAYVTNSTHALMTLVQEQPETEKRLLELSEKTPKVALCSHDAHGIPSYETEFKIMAQYLPVKQSMPEDAGEAARWVIQSLARGDGHCVFRALGDASEFSIQGLDGPRRAKVGAALRVMIPPTEALEVRLKVMGPGTLEADGRTVKLTKTGPVQIEVWRRAPGFMGSEWRPWIVPSPIMVHD